MTASMVRFGARARAVALLLAAVPVAAWSQTVTANIRGRVVGNDGLPIASATVTATNTETGVARRLLTDPDGRYRLLGLALGNYRVVAQAIGHRPLEKTGFRLQIGDEFVVDFTLEAAAVEVAAVPVVVEQTPLVDPSKAGVGIRVSQDQIENLPANGRNFIDFLALAPTVAVTPNFGAGGHISIGGGRASGTAVQIDGVQTTGTFFGGDARGFERQPISYTIESVKEFQVITNDYDVSKGGFTGGLVNAVTKSGTNEYHGSVFEFYRNQNLTAVDFLGVAPSSYRSHQFGGSLGGPILKNRLHFFFALDRQDRQSPSSNLDTSTPAAATALGIADSTLTKIDSIMKNIYGINPGTRGTFLAQVNETAVLGRFDWAISNHHRLTFRDNYTNMSLTHDRLVSTDFTSNGGPVPGRTNSAVLNLFSNWSNFFNEIRFQTAYDDKPRPPDAVCTASGAVCSPMPQVRINVGGRFVALGSDSIIHANNLQEKTLQFVEQLTYNRGSHSFLLGTDNTRFHIFNLFFNNSLGTWTWNYPGADSVVLNRLRSQRPSAYTRSIPYAGVGTPAPTADYAAWQLSAFAQDRFQATRKLLVTAGVRLDKAVFPDTARANPGLLTTFPDAVTNRKLSVPMEVSPRAGFTYDVFGDQRTIVRGGGGKFVGYVPYVLWSNAFLNTGRDQLQVICSGASVPAPNLAADVANPDSIPGACVGAGAPPPKPGINFFSDQFRMPYSLKGNIGFDHQITADVKIGGDLSYAKMKRNYTVLDRNLKDTITAVLSGEGGRVVIGTYPTGSGSNPIRRDTNFTQVIEHDNRGHGDYFSAGADVAIRIGSRTDLTASYQYSRARDDYSVPCCISFSLYRFMEAGQVPANDLSDNFGPADFDQAHKVVLSLVHRTSAGGTFGILGRYYSGLPYSPAISSAADANGDGTRGNDRVYIPRNQSDISLSGTAAQQAAAWATLDSIINANTCLARQRGTIASRNSCRNPGQFLIDLHVSQRVVEYQGRTLELVADLFNLLNGLNKNWGRVTQVSSSSNEVPLLRVQGFDAVNNRYVYSVVSSYGTPGIEAGATLAQFQLQVGARLRF